MASSSGLTDDFERLEQVSLTDPVATKRMLIIVNPYATTVSDRLKHLVVSALRGRYDVEAIDTARPGHATELCREAAVRFGWERFIGEDGAFIGMSGFGASASFERLYKEFGITAEAVAAAAKAKL